MSRSAAVFLMVLAVLSSILTGPPAQADDKPLDVYSTPGIHVSGGRHWKTTCEAYSTTVERCRTQLWGPRVIKVNGAHRVEEGWVFNNLTYLPSERETWQGNPLATPGEHTVDGRRWKTECDTAWTGQGGCRSMLWATTEAVRDGKVIQATGWVFNNIVMFSSRAVEAVEPSDRKPEGLILDYEIIGESREGRPIEAWLIGDPEATTTSMIIGQMHGEERHVNRTAWEILKNQRPIKGVQIWVIPTMNPDGEAVGRRQNAAGVDLNGNFGINWTRKTGHYGSGTAPFSEPESRAIRDFVAKIEPHELVSLHQPLFAVDSYELKSQSLHDRLVTHLQLPSRRLSCRDGVCRGTMTQWINAHHPTAAITIEYGLTPAPEYYLVTARDGLVRVLGGTY